MVEGMSLVVNVMLSLMSVISPPPALSNISLRTLGVLTSGVSLVSWTCDAICMRVVNNQFELLEVVFHYVYVDLQYDEISLTFTAGSVCLCGACSPVVVLGQSVRFSWYPMLWMRLLR